MQDEAEQKATILIHFYPEVTVENMRSYRKKQEMLSHRNRKCGILCLCKKECVYKSEFEKVSEWDTTIQDTMEEYDNVER